MRRLFHYIYTGLRDPAEPGKGAHRRSMSISNLCKVIDDQNLGKASAQYVVTTEKTNTYAATT